jgi:plasmid stabilization system protein ParE
MNYRVVFSLEAEEQLVALYRYIADAASSEIAERYTESIVNYCDSLKTAPHRGKMRDDIRPGLRVTNYKKRTLIAYAVDENLLDKHEGLVSILGVFYGGQDYEKFLEFME